MKENEWGTTNALLKLKKKRHIINPNEVGELQNMRTLVL